MTFYEAIRPLIEQLHLRRLRIAPHKFTHEYKKIKDLHYIGRTLKEIEKEAKARLDELYEPLDGESKKGDTDDEAEVADWRGLDWPTIEKLRLKRGKDGMYYDADGKCYGYGPDGKDGKGPDGKGGEGDDSVDPAAFEDLRGKIGGAERRKGENRRRRGLNGSLLDGSGADGDGNGDGADKGKRDAANLAMLTPEKLKELLPGLTDE